MATTRLYAPRPVDAFDPGIAGVAPILATGTDVDNTKLTAVQAAAVAAGLGTLSTSAGGTAPTPVAEPLRFRGAWQASTGYSYGDVVVQGGVQYVAPMSFTSGLSFVAANWTRLGTYDGTDASLSGAFDAAGAAAAAQTAAQTFATAAIATQSTADRASYLPVLVPSPLNLGLKTGIDLTGATNMNAIFNAAVAEEREIYIPDGDLLLSSSLTRRVRLKGAGTGRTRIIQDGQTQALLVAGSLSSTTVALTVDAAEGAWSLTADATAIANAGIVAGDYLNLRSAKAWTGTDKAAVFGEQVHVASVAGTVINLRAPIEDAYAVADTSVLARFSLVDNMTVEDLTFQNLAPTTKQSPAMVEFRFTRRAQIANVDVIGSDGQAICFYASRDFLADGTRFYDLTDNAANNQYGYGVDVRECCRDGRIIGAYMRGGRHLFTTTSTAGADAYIPAAPALGVPRHILLADFEVTETTNAGVDTHFEGSDITIDGGRIHGIKAWGLTLRGRRVSARNVDINETIGPGVWVRENATDQTRIENVRSRRARTGVAGDGSTYQGQGLRLENFAQPTTVNGFVARDSDEDGVYIGGSGAAVHRFRNVDIIGAGQSGTNRNGVRYASARSVVDIWQNVSIEGSTIGFFGPAGQKCRVDNYRTPTASPSAAGRVSGGMLLVEATSPTGIARVRPISGRAYSANGTSAGTATLAQNDVRVAPFSLDADTTFSTISLEITTGAAGGAPRLLIYHDNGYGEPGALLLDSSTISAIDASTTGVKPVTINLAMLQGDYWLGAVAQGSASIGARVIQGKNSGVGISSISGNNGTIGHAVSGVTGAPPNPFGTPGFQAGTVAHVWLTAA